MAHLMGKRRFETGDDSRNSWILAFVTLGEGWHNNHHRYQSATRNGFYWWEIDITYYGLKALSWTKFIWGLKPVPESIMEEAARADHQATIAAAAHAAHAHSEFSSLKKVVPAAAAIAVATATSHVALPRRAVPPGIHRDDTAQAQPMGAAKPQDPPVI
jgi:stearoyl-CoA desaturase (delta-9 desaturase)